MGVDSGAELRAVDCCARLEDEGEDMGVKRKGKRGLDVVEKSKGLVVTSLADVRRQLLGEGKEALIAGGVGAHFGFPRWSDEIPNARAKTTTSSVSVQPFPCLHTARAAYLFQIDANVSLLLWLFLNINAVVLSCLAIDLFSFFTIAGLEEEKKRN